MANLKTTTMNDNKQTLQEYYELCRRAYNWTSFNPDARATTTVKEFSEMLDADLIKLGGRQGNYKMKFIEKFTSWMSAKSRCASSMITGGSNFNVRGAQKANNAEHNHATNFWNWREKYFLAVNRTPTKSPEDEIEVAFKDLDRLKNNQIEMKEINVAIRKSKLTTPAEIVNHLAKNNFSPDMVARIREGYGEFAKYKIPSYVLTNSNAKIKSREAKVRTMEARIDRKNTWQDIKFDGGYITIEDDRLKIFHEEKPEKEIIANIKANGFRWSPNWKCWCRKHTGNAIYSLRYLNFLKK